MKASLFIPFLSSRPPYHTLKSISSSSVFVITYIDKFTYFELSTVLSHYQRMMALVILVMMKIIYDNDATDTTTNNVNHNESYSMVMVIPIISHYY